MQTNLGIVCGDGIHICISAPKAKMHLLVLFKINLISCCSSFLSF